MNKFAQLQHTSHITLLQTKNREFITVHQTTKLSHGYYYTSSTMSTINQLTATPTPLSGSYKVNTTQKRTREAHYNRFFSFHHKVVGCITELKHKISTDDLVKDYIIAILPLLAAFILPLLLAIANIIIF